MADTKISALADGSTLQAADELPVRRSTGNNKITGANLLAYVNANATITESQISDLGSYLTTVAIADVSDITITTPADNEVLAYNSGTSQWINQTAAEAGLAAASHTHATTDITSGTFADARIAQSNVTQHQAALTITESQISDLGTYLTTVALADLTDVDATVATPSDGDILVYRTAGSDWVLEAKPAGGSNPALNDVTDVTITTVADNEVLAYNSGTGEWINQTAAEAGLAAASHTHATTDITSGTFADARIAQSNVTQHQAALTITESQISDLGTYLTDIVSDTTPQLGGALDGQGNTISNYENEYKDETGTTYTFIDGDRGKVITFNNADAITVTVPNSLPIGWTVTCIQLGAGQVTFSAGASATVNNRQSHTKIAGQYGMVTLTVYANSGGSSAVVALGGDTAA